jgi:hypothetical protein
MRMFQQLTVSFMISESHPRLDQSSLVGFLVARCSLLAASSLAAAFSKTDHVVVQWQLMRV